MELVKVAGRNVKLLCPCKRQFWASQAKVFICPDCKEAWNGLLIKYFIVRLQSERNNDYVTVYAGKHTSASACISELIRDAADPFLMSSGISIQEISLVDYAQLDEKKINKSCFDFLAVLKGRA